MRKGQISRRGFLAGGNRNVGDDGGFTISSVLVQARPEEHARLEPLISALPGTGVHASTGAGKLVVVIETPSDAELVRRIDEIGALPGVLGVNLVFHHTEPEESLRKETRDG